MLTLGAGLLRCYRNAVDEKLGTGYDYLISRLDSIQNYVVISHDLADLQCFLMDDKSAFRIGFCHKSEIQAPDAGDSDNGHHGMLLAAPNYAGTNKLGITQNVIVV